MNRLISGIAVAFLLAAPAALAEPIIDDGHAFAFYVDDVRDYFGELHHSGHRSWVENGVSAQDWSAPDCLVLVNDQAPLDRRKAAAFLDALVVRDEVNRFDPTLPSNLLQWTPYYGNHVYFLRGLSRFVDGIAVRTVDPAATFNGLRLALLGEEATNLRLVLSRSCKLARP